MKKLILITFALLSSVMMTGCNDNKAKELVGSWTQKTPDEYPSEISIEFSKDHYAINVKKFDPQLANSKKAKRFKENFLRGSDTPRKPDIADFSDCWRTYAYVGKALSDTEITGDGFTIRYEIESNTLLYDGNKYMKK